MLEGKYSKNDEDLSEGHTSELDKVSTGQIWDSFRIGINNSNGLQITE